MNYKNYVLSLLLLFVLAAASANEKTGALLWRISGNGLEHPSYIFGTHHLYPISFLDSVAGLKTAFESSNQVVGELLMYEMPKMMYELQRAGMMPQDTTWQMLLSEDDYIYVDEKLSSLLGVGLQLLGILNPAMINMTVSVAFYQQIFPQANQGESMDIWFQQQALLRDIPIIGLETVQDQITAIFDVASLKRQAADLICMLKNLDFTEYSIRKLNNLYRAADLTALYEMLWEESPCPWSSEQEIAINNTRNKNWLKKLPEIMAAEPSFVAVGALHLPGEAGLLVGLKKAGYTVEPVK